MNLTLAASDSTPLRFNLSFLRHNNKTQWIDTYGDNISIIKSEPHYQWYDCNAYSQLIYYSNYIQLCFAMQVLSKYKVTCSADYNPAAMKK